MMFHYKYVDERVRQEMPQRAGEIGWYIVRIDDPDNSAAISQEIDKLFANSRAETKTETERAFQQGFLSAASAIITAMNIMSFVIIGIILLVVGNTMIMSARERTHEFAVLKALGFSGGQLFFLHRRRVADPRRCSAARSAWRVTFPAVEGFQTALPKGLVSGVLHQAGDGRDRLRCRTVGRAAGGDHSVAPGLDDAHRRRAALCRLAEEAVQVFVRMSCQCNCFSPRRTRRSRSSGDKYPKPSRPSRLRGENIFTVNP